MKHIQYFFTLVLFISLGNNCLAQSIGPQTLNAAGGSAVVAGNNYEWSIGEMVAVNTVTASNITVTQGLLQPILQTTGIDDVNFNWGGIQIYPNPVNDRLQIKFNMEEQLDVVVQLMDVTGRIYTTEKFSKKNGMNIFEIDCSALSSGAYILNLEAVEKGATFSNTYKIIKK